MTYEQVAQFILNRIAADLGLERVEGKQSLVGTATDWEVDGKGVRVGDQGFVLIECKRYPKRRITQHTVGGFAFSIQDVGASGGYLVSPLGLQEGAKRIADCHGIVEVQLNANSTTTDFVLSFLNRVYLGVSQTINWHSHAEVVVHKPEDGR
ncbi:restriction endonuclease [Nocardia xishanensis]|uniref:Restriction endonuclease n=1 Tax=Nocardia xishanensis TaxID=238964 RepID=A0ABW7XAX7_9NOCA